MRLRDHSPHQRLCGSHVAAQCLPPSPLPPAQDLEDICGRVQCLDTRLLLLEAAPATPIRFAVREQQATRPAHAYPVQYAV